MHPTALSERPAARPPRAASPPFLADRTDRIARYDGLAPQRERFRRRNSYYHREIENAYRFIIPEGASVLEVGCGPGDLLAAVKPSRGVGIRSFTAPHRSAATSYSSTRSVVLPLTTCILVSLLVSLLLSLWSRLR